MDLNREEKGRESLSQQTSSARLPSSFVLVSNTNHGQTLSPFYLTSSGSFQVVYTLLEAPHLLLDNPELDIEGFVEFHKSIDVVVNLVKTAFHAGEPFLQVLYNRNNPGVVHLE